MKVVILMENSTCRDAVACAHGLSMYIETDKHKILFDMGPDAQFIDNAKALSVDLTQVDIAFLSHAHNDHCGGLEAFLKLNDRAKVYMQKAVWGQYYVVTPSKCAYIGMDAVLLTTAGSDPLYRRASRVSMGNVFLIPWTYLPESGDWTQLLRDLGFRTVAMALRNDSVRLDDPRLAAEEKLAIVMGTEGDGLASSTIASCDYTVKIPMYHGVDSLNVAAASAVAFYELGLPPLNEKED